MISKKITQVYAQDGFSDLLSGMENAELLSKVVERGKVFKTPLFQNNKVAFEIISGAGFELMQSQKEMILEVADVFRWLEDVEQKAQMSQD
ncbi:MAG: hypothetical protein PHN38_06010 [Sulfurospirillaceae bacterium]|nr:hypothetical protein [Sulfurospirillaceae bacterium]